MVDLMSLLSDALIGSFQMLMLNDFGKNMFPYRIKTCWKRILIYGVTALVILGVDQDGNKKRPYIIHRTSVGCYERTLAWLIEKYAGKFPTWLCPEQVRVLPISEKFHDYAEGIDKKLKSYGIRSSVDERSEKIGYKIRDARLHRVPYMLVVGQKEEENETVSVRSRYLGDEGTKKLDEFISAITEEIRTKQIRKIEVEEQ